VTFRPQETTQTLVIQTNPGAANAPDKTINLTLSLAPDSASLARLSDVTQTSVTILGGGQAPAPPAPKGPGATDIQLLQNGQGVKGAAIHFNVALDAKQAKNAREYALRKLSGARPPKVARALYDANSNTVTLRFSGPLRRGSSALLVLNAGKLTTAAGQPITG